MERPAIGAFDSPLSTSRAQAICGMGLPSLHDHAVRQQQGGGVPMRGSTHQRRYTAVTLPWTFHSSSHSAASM
jgi:hypothetical protein